MANWSATLATLGALVRPQSLQPSLVVPSIAHLDWHALKHRAHVHAVVIDKDNCIARPDEDTLADDDALRASWDRLLAEFGPDRVLVVSNSAGDLRKDPLRIQAETVSRNLGVPVLVHPNPKPAYACAKQIAAHFLLAPNPTDRSVADDVVYSPLARARARIRAIEAVETMSTTTTGTRLRSQLAAAAESGSDGALSSTPPSSVFRVLVIGDRLTTDMILAHRLSSLSLPFSTRRVPSPSPPTTSPPPVSWLSHFRLWPSSSSTTRRLFPSTISIGQDGQTIESVGILTTRLWGREGAGTTLMRTVEKMAVRAFEKRKARARAQRGRVAVTEKGTRPDWREFTTGLRIETQEELLVTKPQVPVPDTAAPASATTSRPPLWQRLPSLDFAAVRSFPSRIPTLASSFVHSIPDRVHNLTTATFRALVRALELYGPRMIATSERGLQKLVDVYHPARPQEMREPRSAVPSVPIERALDRVEQRWEEAGQTLDRYKERWEGTAASVRAMAMAARRRTGGGGGGVAVPAAQEEVQGKEAAEVAKGSAVR